MSFVNKFSKIKRPVKMLYNAYYCNNLYMTKFLKRYQFDSVPQTYRTKAFKSVRAAL